ncbi:TBC1 domain family member 20-like isoform X3 [Paroedura picta]|uniref:TBC1 domain family member 20-like isoform X3 n=1 Tax=Paroedura picta TaxID=143630 RepID=UPI0040579DF2
MPGTGRRLPWPDSDFVVPRPNAAASLALSEVGPRGKRSSAPPRWAGSAARPVLPEARGLSFPENYSSRDALRGQRPPGQWAPRVAPAPPMGGARAGLSPRRLPLLLLLLLPPGRRGDEPEAEAECGQRGPGRRGARRRRETGEAAADPPGPGAGPRRRGGAAGGGAEPGGAPDRRAPPQGRDVRQNHKDYNQVLLDVCRSSRRFPPGMRAEQRQILQEQLVDVILCVLRAHPELHYYQGYHDVAVTLLLVAGERMAIALLERLSTLHLRDFMDPTMDSTKHILNYLMPLLQQESPRLHDFMLRAEVGTIFALSWLITWYGHVLSPSHHILRLYDFFLASHPLMAVYFATVVVLYREEEVLACDCDLASVHQLLSHIPPDLPYESLIARAHQLFQQLPPTELAKKAALQHHKSRRPPASAQMRSSGGSSSSGSIWDPAGPRRTRSVPPWNTALW